MASVDGRGPAGVVETAHLFPALHAELVALLRSLDADEWARPTACAGWSVKDVAAHLLDGDLRRLSVQRDGHAPPPPSSIASYADLVAFIDRLNREWVEVARRVSPRLLTTLLETTGRQAAELFASLDPRAPALYGVAWAGEAESRMWLDVAREYTERWHHQEQIRDATGRPGLQRRELFHPVLDAFLRALPHAYRDVDAPEGTAAVVAVTGEAGGDWTVVREGGAWRLYHGRPAAPASIVTIGQDAAWRLCVKQLRDPERHARIEGRQDLGRPVLGMVSVMA